MLIMTKCLGCQREMDAMEATFSYYCRKCRRHVPKSEWRIPTYVTPSDDRRRRKKRRKPKPNYFPEDIDRYFSDDDQDDDENTLDGFQIYRLPDEP